MAKPIKETPVLKGNDAKVFFERIDSSSSRKVSQADLARMRENYAKMKAISKF